MGIKALGNVSVLNVNDGQNGAPGQRGASVIASIPQYYLSTSPSSLVGGQWEDSPREVTTGTYLWERIRTTLDDNTVIYSDAVYSATISGVKHDVDQINNSITNKVWQSDINSSINSYDGSTVSSIRDRVTQTETDITGITSRVSDVESETDDLGTRMSSAESSITQNANNIALKVSADGVISSINQSPEQITISADKVNIAGAAIFDSYSLKSQTVSDFAVMYAKSTDPDTFTPVSGADGQWSVNAPEWEAGKYIWQRTAKTINGNTTYSYTCIQGASGQSSYTYVRYSANANGSGMVTSPSSATKYIGIYTGDSSTVPAYTAFTWSKYIGEDGNPGNPGTSSYTFVRYSANSDGSSMTSSPQSNSKFIGIYTGTSSTAPSTASSYTWSQYRGNDGTSVSITSIKYAISDTEDQPNDSSFTYTSVPTVAEGKWLWTLTEYNSGTKLYTKSKQGVSGTNGTNGTNGLNVATVYLYQRATSSPSKPSSQLTYTFSTGKLSGTLGSWSQEIPSGTNPIWMTIATASASTTTDTIASSEWTTPVELVRNGTNGTDGIDGLNGYNQATINLYQRATSAPSKPSSAITYTFATGALSTIPSGWYRAVPASNGNPCYVISATAIGRDATYSITSSSWSDVTKMVEDGVSGINSATVYLYQRAASSPSKPSSSLTYTFSTGKLSGTLGSWTQTVPDGANNTNPVWMIIATANESATATTDAIDSSEWSTPVQLVKDGTNGTNGADGTDGYNQATIYLYQRAASAPSKPSSAVTYTFSTGALSSTPSGWNRSIPASNGNPCYVTSVSVVSKSATYSIAASSWSSPSKMVEDGVSVTSVTTTPSTADDGYSTVTITLSDGSSETFQVKNGSKGSTGDTAAWFYGTALTHTSGNATSNVSGAVVGSMYLNTNTSNVYKCTAISGNTMTWAYAGSLLTGLIDVLDVGGVNLHKDSERLIVGWTYENATVSNGIATIVSTGSGNHRIYQMPASGLWEIWEANTTYTVSVDAKASTSGIVLSLEPFANNVSPSRVNLTTEWKRYSYTFTTGLSTSTSSCTYLLYSGTGSIQLRKPKLEKGNVATAWTPAPEDALAKSQQIYCRSNSSSTPSAPTAIVTNTSDNVNYSSSNVNGTWTVTRLPMIDINNTNYKYCFTCEQMISVGGYFIGTTPVVADKAHTVIDGGNIITHSITSSQLATDAIQSLAYSKDDPSSPYSTIGTFLDLQNGNFYTKNFGVDNDEGKAYLNGEIIATSGRIGENSNTAWTIGTYTNSGGYDYGSIIANGDAFIQSGKWMISQDRIDTRWYNNNGQMTYLYDSSSNTYFDYGINVPNPSSTTRLGDTFLYIRKHVGSIPVSDGDWTYLFRVAKDGTVYVNGVAIAGADGDFLSKSATSLQTVAGSVTFTQQINGSITNAGSLSTSGTIRTNLSSTSTATYTSGGNITPGVTGTLPVGNGGTGQTTAKNAANAFMNALDTGSDTPKDADYYISQYVNGGSTTTTYHRRPMSALWSYIKNKLSSDHSILDNLYVSTSGGVINGSLVADEIIAGSLIVNGDARFVNAINGDLTGNASSATVALKVADSGNGTETTFAYSKSGLSTTSWFAAWSGYELRAISPANVLTTIGADKSASISDRINVTSSGSYNWSSSTNDDKLITSNTLAYWNGAYSSSSHNSNIEYVKAGKLGDIVTHNASEFLGASATATKANALATTGTIKTNLASTSDATYTSGGNITPGVTGTLAIGNGGTGETTALNAYYKLQDRSSSSNLNDAINRGLYYYNNSTTNTPVASTYGVVFNLINSGASYNGSNNWIWQLATNTSGNNLFLRNKINNGSWSSWTTFYSTSNKPSKSDVGLGNVDNYAQVRGLSSGTTSGHLVTWGANGYTVSDSGVALAPSGNTRGLVSGVASNSSGQLVLTYADGSTSQGIDVEFVATQTSSVQKADALNVNGSAVGSASVPVYFDEHGKPQRANTIPTITDTYSSTSSNGMSGKAVASAIGALDANLNNTSPSAGKTLTAFNQTDGKVTATFGDISITKSQISDFPTSMTPTSHTHVPTNITTSTDSVAGGLDPITASYIGSSVSNKSFGLPAAAIVIEYSTNGGSSWTAYPATDNEKRDLFNETRAKNFVLGNGATPSTNNQLRITIEPTDRYTSFHGVYVWMSTQGNTCVMTLERSTIGAKDTFSTVFTDRNVAGWSGNNIIYFSQGTFGGGSTQTTNQYKYRMTFKHTAMRSSSVTNSTVQDIRFLGYNVWTSPNNIVSYNRMYTWDRDFNVTFPASLSAAKGIILKDDGIWIQGGSEAGGNYNRMTLTSGMPTELKYNGNKRGTRIYSNAIAIADPYNGNSNNDAGWIRHIEETGNSGILEIAVGDDANESIVVRQYNTSSAVARELVLLNSSGNSSFPGTVTATTFSGNATSATTASKLGSSTVGGTDRPIYLNAGTATQTTYRMASTNAVATTARAITDNLETGIWYVNGTNSADLYSIADGAAYVNKYDNNWIAEIYQDYRTGQIALRGKNNGTWQAWRKVLDSSNYTTWAVSLSGNQTIAGTKTFSSMILANAGIAANNGSSTTGGVGLYSTVPDNYGIAMRATTNLGKHGYVQGDWAIYNCMSGSDATNKLTRGWIWRNATDNIGVASISGAGNAVFNGSVTIGGNTGNTSGARMEFNSTTKSIDFIFN